MHHITMTQPMEGVASSKTTTSSREKDAPIFVSRDMSCDLSLHAASCDRSHDVSGDASRDRSHDLDGKPITSQSHKPISSKRYMY